MRKKLTKDNHKEFQNWLILSHCFNMDGRAASQTITDKLPYFVESGINLYVLSAITGKKDDRFFINKLLVGGHHHSGSTFDIGLLIVLVEVFI